MDREWLDAREATTRLGVKPQTLYAYVSRGLVHSEPVPGEAGRARRYRRSDIERLADRGPRRPAGDGPEVVVDTAVTRLDPAGRLAYRGWDVTEAARTARFEEVAAWLWDVPLGPNAHWSAPDDALALARAVQRPLPAAATAGDRLRVVVAALRAADPLRDDRRPSAVAARAGSLLATLVEALPPVDARDRPSEAGSVAARLWPRLTATEPTKRRVRALDGALSLLADHELATSTFAARVAASTWADPYLAVLAGLAALGGPLHGGASEQVRALLRTTDRSPAVAVGAVLQSGAPVPGFGHSVYTGPDPRTPVLLEFVEAAKPPTALWRTAQEVLAIVDDGGTDSAGPHPNIDFALGVLAEAGHFAPGGGEAVFAIARTAGWIAHALEEYPHRLRYRTQALYTGD
ncbi:MAG: citrate/2-methylcitrate synthase [Acidimicrobiia bacterium]